MRNPFKRFGSPGPGSESHQYPRSRSSNKLVILEGINFIIPFAEQVIQLEVRTLKFEANATAASNDLQEVQTTIALNYHISPSQANIIYQQLGADYADRIIAPTIQESVKASVAKFNAEELQCCITCEPT